MLYPIAGRHPDVCQGSQYPLPRRECHPDTEGKTDIFRIAIQRGQGSAAAFAGAQGSQPDGGADQGARFMAMDTLQRL